MVFSSVAFMFWFLPLALAAYYVPKVKLATRNIILLVISLLFYAWGEPQFVLLLLFSGVFHWFMGLQLEKQVQANRRKIILILSCVYDVGILFLFKYWNFAADSINGLLRTQILPLHELALPLGISFFTFQCLSYVIDVYRKDVPAEKEILTVLLYVSMFPQLLSGPIVRYHTIADQLKNREHSRHLFAEGVSRFVVGLAKKLILSTAFAAMADHIFELSLVGHGRMPVPVTLAWLGSLAYTLQIYLDFSSYSDMALGMANIFGFRFEENFNYPYMSRSVGEFWRRWHISLGTWFREYIYFPLGGSRMESLDGIFRNMLVVWLLTGLWHGAAWTFILWGLLNYLFIVLERLFMLERRGGNGIWRNIYTMFVINLSWVFFRCENFYHLTEYLGNMFGSYGNGFYSPYVGMFLRENWMYWIVGLLICVPVAPMLRQRLQEKWPKAEPVIYCAGMFLLFILSMIYLFRSGYTSFIYFNF